MNPSTYVFFAFLRGKSNCGFQDKAAPAGSGDELAELSGSNARSLRFPWREAGTALLGFALLRLVRRRDLLSVRSGPQDLQFAEIHPAAQGIGHVHIYRHGAFAA